MTVCNLVGSEKLPLMTTGLKLIMPENIPFQIRVCVNVIIWQNQHTTMGNSRFGLTEIFKVFSPQTTSPNNLLVGTNIVYELFHRNL